MNLKKTSFFLAMSLFYIALMSSIHALSIKDISLYSTIGPLPTLLLVTGIPLVVTLIGIYLVYTEKNIKVGQVALGFGTIASAVTLWHSTAFILLATILSFNKKYRKKGLILAAIGALILLAPIIIVLGFDVTY